jgi:hypothetical protein
MLNAEEKTKKGEIYKAQSREVLMDFMFEFFNFIKS